MLFINLGLLYTKCVSLMVTLSDTNSFNIINALVIELFALKKERKKRFLKKYASIKEYQICLTYTQYKKRKLQLRLSKS
jgi:hypothetical protein